MLDLALDSCVMVKWVVPESDSALADQVVTDAARDGRRLIALDLGLIEVGNGLWKQFHRGLLSAAEVTRLYGLVVGRPLHVEPAHPRIPAALDLAARYDRSVYDSLFVALTIELGVEGVTSDEPLWRAIHADHPHIHLLRNWPPPP
ncbi:MAG TPA: type II toxin-antitoxin system VapC family toxin [Gemmataceae bacterium]|jgi:predicted nucleic acid-binding protein